MRAAVILAALMLTISSCGGGGQQGAGAGEYEIDRRVTRGPVDLRVAVSRKEITIADRVELLIEATARDGYVVELPRFGEKLDQFGIVDYTTPPPELLGDGTVVTRRTYELEPFLSGEYMIPPMAVTFREEGDTLTHMLESDTLTVSVLSILPEDMEELELKDIAGPVSLPASKAWIYYLAGAVAAAAGAAYFWFFIRKRKQAVVRRITAHEVAFARLEQLLAQGLIEEKRYAEFTEKVSDVLRHYIEDRFGLRAPERTTEEFIVEAGDGLPVDGGQKGILREFLNHCDLVKFAAYEPSPEDVRRTFETCRDFVDATKKEEEEVSTEAA